MAKWYACFEMDAGNQICRDLLTHYGCTSQSAAIYAVLIKQGCDGYPERIGCGCKELCWWDGEWFHTHYNWVKNSSGTYSPEEIEITDRQIRNEYALAAEELHDDVLVTAKEHDIDPDDIEWEENPYDDEDPDDFYYCEWKSDGDHYDEEDEEE